MENESDPEFQELGDKLYNREFTTMEQRAEMMARALELSLEDSLQVMIVDSKRFVPPTGKVSLLQPTWLLVLKALKSPPSPFAGRSGRWYSTLGNPTLLVQWSMEPCPRFKHHF